MTYCATRGRWNPLNIFIMVLGFVIWWPLGLAALGWILCGDSLRKDRVIEGFDRVRDGVRDSFGSVASGGFGARRPAYGATGNAAFDDYRRQTLERLDEERRKLEEERREFGEFVTNLRRARDKEEFDRFMSERSRSRGSDA